MFVFLWRVWRGQITCLTRFLSRAFLLATVAGWWPLLGIPKFAKLIFLLHLDPKLSAAGLLAMIFAEFAMFPLNEWFEPGHFPRDPEFPELIVIVLFGVELGVDAGEWIELVPLPPPEVQYFRLACEGVRFPREVCPLIPTPIGELIFIPPAFPSAIDVAISTNLLTTENSVLSQSLWKIVSSSEHSHKFFTLNISSLLFWLLTTMIVYTLLKDECTFAQT